MTHCITARNKEVDQLQQMRKLFTDSTVRDTHLVLDNVLIFMKAVSDISETNHRLILESSPEVWSTR
jgi:hypothetical protein